MEGEKEGRWVKRDKKAELDEYVKMQRKGQKDRRQERKEGEIPRTRACGRTCLCQQTAGYFLSIPRSPRGLGHAREDGGRDCQGLLFGLIEDKYSVHCEIATCGQGTMASSNRPRERGAFWHELESRTGGSTDAHKSLDCRRIASRQAELMNASRRSSGRNLNVISLYKQLAMQTERQSSTDVQDALPYNECPRHPSIHRMPKTPFHIYTSNA